MKKILYFEDEKWFAEIIFHDIEKNGYEVTLVTKPADFFKEINSICQYDLFILDIMAPMILFTENDLEKNFNKAQCERLQNGLNVGVVFYEKIREIDKYKETPVIFYTAKRNPQIDDVKVKYISKPVLSEQIVMAVSDFLKN